MIKVSKYHRIQSDCFLLRKLYKTVHVLTLEGGSYILNAASTALFSARSVLCPFLFVKFCRLNFPTILVFQINYQIFSFRSIILLFFFQLFCLSIQIHNFHIFIFCLYLLIISSSIYYFQLNDFHRFSKRFIRSG